MAAISIHRIHIQWWQDIHTGAPIARSRTTLLLLANSEIYEAVEGMRKNLMDDKLPHRKMEEVEMADCYIRLMDYAGGFKIKLNYANRVPFRETFKDKSEALMALNKSILKIYDSVFNPHLEPLYLSRSISMIENYCRINKWDLAGAVEEKLAFNQVRKDHKHEARRQKHGKRF